MESNKELNGRNLTIDIGINYNSMESINHYVDEVSTKVDKLQQRMNTIEQLRSTLLKKSPHNSKSSFIERDKDKDMHISSYMEQHQDASKKGAFAPNTAHKLFNHYNTILSQVRRKKEKDKWLSLEAYHDETARDINRELNELSLQLEKLRENVLQQCRKMSTEEKKKLGSALSRLTPKDLIIALEIVAANNPGFEASAEDVDLDLDAQSESTLWRLKFFAQRALGIIVKSSVVTNGNITNAAQIVAPPTTIRDNTPTTSICKKRKREICEAILKNANKRA